MEKWINEIPTLEHLTGYKINSRGEVFSYLKPTIGKGRIILETPYKKLKPFKTKKGYLRVTIRNKNLSVHRLVALSFINNPFNKEHVNHIDCYQENNKISNLEWATNKIKSSYGFKWVYYDVFIEQN